MTQHVIQVRDDAECQELGAFLADRLYEFNAKATGYFDGKLLAGCVRSDSGEVIAGFNGRGQGLGTLLPRSAEAEAVARGCVQVVLATHSFQAPEFYERMGYARRYAIDANPKGYSDIIFVKVLPKAQPRSVCP